MDKYLKELLKRIVDNDQEAFNLLYNETIGLVYSVIYPILQDKQLTEDASQDTYMRALSKINLFNPKKRFTPWLAQIAKNIAFDYQRQKSRSQKKVEKLIKEPEESPEISKTSFDMGHYLEKLDEPHRRIVTMHIVGKLSFKEIGVIENRPLTTIYSMYKKSLSTMKKAIEKEVLE